MALNKVEICGVNTSKLPVLTAEEKAEKHICLHHKNVPSGMYLISFFISPFLFKQIF